MPRITITITIDTGDESTDGESRDQVDTGAMVVHVDQPRFVGFRPDGL